MTSTHLDKRRLLSIAEFYALVTERLEPLWIPRVALADQAGKTIGAIMAERIYAMNG